MNSQRSIDLFYRALQLKDAAERRAFLERACAGQPTLRDEVESLVQAYEQAGDFLATPVMRQDTNPKPSNTRIGRYRLLETLGEGGYGTVYLADQVEPVQRKVALKIIKPGMDTRQVISRFEGERQALALMDHPNIARVLDAGETDAGRPYFVMEWVRGTPMMEYCDKNRLTTTERLKLFIKVCHAVQHAHQKGVIHRDLKPSNVLVVEQEGEPAPKVIDFGVAKALGCRPAGATLLTGIHDMLGTPAYMSPEQTDPGGLDVDTRSDVYSLGVLLYELLTGVTPLDAVALGRAGSDETLRMIRETELPRPSSRLLSIGPEIANSAERRRTEPKALTTFLRGDLDWIVMKCLEKDRHRRYGTADALAQDISRFLNNEPVLASPPSLSYLMGKYVRRHRRTLAMGSALVLLLIAGTVVSTREAVRATRAEGAQAELRRLAQAHEQTAISEAAKSGQVARFLSEMLQGVGPSVAQGRDTTLLREILNKTVERVGNELTNQPDVEAQLLNTIGNVYGELGDHSKAEAAHRRSLLLWSRSTADRRPEMLESLHGLAMALDEQGRWSESEAAFRRALELTNAATDAESGLLLGLASVLSKEGRLSEAESTGRRALAMQRRRFGDENQEVARMLRCLAEIAQKQGRLDEAGRLMRAQLELSRKLGDNMNTAWSLNVLSGILLAEGRLAEAESLTREALSLQKKVYPDAHPSLIDTLSLLNGLLYRQHKLPEQERALKEMLGMQTKRWGEDDPRVLNTIAWLSSILREEGKLSEVQTWMSRATNSLSKLRAEDVFELQPEVIFQASMIEGPDHATTRALCDLVLKLGPTNGGWFTDVARPLVSGPDPALAVKLAGQAVKASPAERSAWETLGVAQYRAGDWSGAVQNLTKAGQCDLAGPSSYELFYLAMAHHQAGNEDLGRRAYSRAVDGMLTWRFDSRLVPLRAEAFELLGLGTVREAGH